MIIGVLPCKGDKHTAEVTRMAINRRPRVAQPAIVKIKMRKVVSSNIELVGHDAKGMYVKYIKGVKPWYLFKEIVEPVFYELLKCKSIGSALHATGLKGEPIEEPAYTL
jgi:hypothetical protein